MTPVRLTRLMLAQSRVIARGARIRDARRLVNRYGGRISQWVKKSSPIFRIGAGRFEYHWYEHPGIGRFEIKLKRVIER